MVDFSRSVYLPKEASKRAVENNGSFAGVLLFPDIPQVKHKDDLVLLKLRHSNLISPTFHSQQIDQNRSLFKNEMLGIEMGANIFNLSQTINVQFTNVYTVNMLTSFILTFS